MSCKSKIGAPRGRTHFALTPWSLLIPLLLLAPAPDFSQAKNSDTPLRVLRTVSAVFSISKSEAARGYPIELEAVVTFSDPEWGNLFIQDRTSPTFIDVHGLSTRYSVGARVRISGISVVHNSSPAIGRVKIVEVGHGALPKAEQTSVAQLDAGAGESHRVVTEGILHPCDHDWLRVCYRIHDGSKMVWVFIPRDEGPDSQKLIGAKVRVTGVAARHPEGSNQRAAAQLYVDSMDDIEVLDQPGPAKIQSVPSLVRELSSAQADERYVAPVHLRGVVTWASQELITIEDGSGTVFVGKKQDVPVRRGETIDAVGFPSHGVFGLELADSIVGLSDEQLSVGGATPMEVSAAEILNLSLNGRRVHLKAKLIGQSENATEFIYQVQDGSQHLHAVLLRGDSTREMVRLAPNSVLELTGVALIQRGNPEWPESLLILVESPSDMVVEGGFGWLTLGRGLAILGAVAVILLTPFIWVTMLRRTVRKQTAIIRARLENELQLEDRFRRLFERNLAAVFTWRPDGTIVECNVAFVKMLGLDSREDLIGRSYWDLEIDPLRREELKNSLHHEALSNRDASLRRDDGSVVRLLENITPVGSNGEMVYETTAIDVSQLRENQAELQKAKDAAVYESLNDPLTCLPNRRFLMDALSILVNRTRREESIFALLYIDLDGFKLINDSLGHPVGDGLLIQMATCLRSWIREGDLLARLGGDEFLVILDRLHSKEDATLVAENLLEAISAPFTVRGHDLSIGASIGISVFPGDSSDAEELLQQADSAMYAAKRDGKNRITHYTPAIGFEVHERLTLENLLRGAVARNEITVDYQPEFDLADCRLVRFEALARWTHPTIGSITPARFIPIAEESGMIVALGAYILELACTEALRWQKSIKHPIQVAVNVSGVQLRNKGFVDEVSAILDRTGLRPELLQLELTESAMLIAAESTTETMMQLRALGITLAVDDFGTGYSNMSYLPSLPFDSLKIDGSFVRNLGTQPESESMIRTLIVLAHNIGMQVIVEGVEKQEQLDIVRALGANEVQGYFTGRPSADPCDVFLRPAARVLEPCAAAKIPLRESA
ncbi:MAG: EAL domain-containing protein [Terracidiphilus sp.]|jgi:diguanylate cyclase (GGDEF)-like protein